MVESVAHSSTLKQRSLARAYHFGKGIIEMQLKLKANVGVFFSDLWAKARRIQEGSGISVTLSSDHKSCCYLKNTASSPRYSSCCRQTGRYRGQHPVGLKAAAANAPETALRITATAVCGNPRITAF